MASPHHPPQAAPASLGWEALLDASADLLALLDEHGRLLWMNAGFVRATGHVAADILNHPVAELLEASHDDPVLLSDWPLVTGAIAHKTPLRGLELPWRHHSGITRWGRLTLTLLSAPGPVPGACWQWVMHEVTDTRWLSFEAQRLAELLDTAQDFGRLGIWERKLPLGEGVWDRHMYRFFGLPVGSGVPDFEEVARRIHPDDRPGQRYRASAHAPGKYSSRYRIVAPGQPIRHVHAQWEVKLGLSGTPELVTGIMVDDTEVYELAESFNKTSAQLKMAVELGNIAIWRHDLKLNRIFYNDRAFEIIDVKPRPEGLSLEEVRAMIHPDDIAEVNAAAARSLNSDRPVDMEARYRRRDGTWRYVLTRRMVRRDDTGQPVEFFGVALDVSEQVEQNRHATEMTKRLEIAAAASGMGIWSRDPVTRKAEWNSQMFAIVGRDLAAGLPSRHEWVETIIHPADRAQMRNAHADMLASNGMTIEHEYRITRPDGEVRWLVNRSRHEVRNGLSMLFGITMDVTDRARTEAALREANERIALAARGAGIGTWERDLKTDRMQWDPQMYLLHGLQPDCGVPVETLRRTLVHADDAARLREAIDTSVRERRMSTCEFRAVMPDGSFRWLALRSVPIVDEAGQPERQLGVNWDIHERVMAEAERQDRVIAERESEAKSQFLARMSHELRTPLNAVLGFAQLLQLTPALTDDQLGKVAHIHSAGEHLLSLINDVLDLSSMEHGQFKLDLQAVSVAEVLDEALPLVQSLANEHGVTIQLDGVSGVAYGDRTRIRQVLINLLSNAIKYNRIRGLVTVSSAPSTEDHQALVVLKVHDTGRGMTASQLNQLFEPFNRLGVEREPIEGTGIGLAVVKALVEHMGGNIGVHSEAGVGSTFEVRLPRAPEPADEVNPSGVQAASTPPPTAKRSGQVLYIEDNPINQILVEELVRSHAGLDIESKDTGQSGVDRAFSLRPDLILIDIQLPDMDGFEVLRLLRASPLTAATPCIALSANAMPEDIARALEAGFDDYWTKPIDFRHFLTAMERLFPVAS
ncbi:MAG: hypothetical protein RLZZ618_3593 [Pseudomonadota bacterium]|jgi:PAS domain S-box-containing protein